MARAEKQGTKARSSAGVTPAQLREAERGLRLILAANFPPAWIAQNVREVLAEANADYVAFLRDHEPARNPTGWLIERARLRALNLVARDRRRSGPSLDSVVHTIEDPDPNPEQALLDDDRIRRIAAAVSVLSEKDRKLIALVYDEGHSIRAAGRLLGWGKSNADYHHKQAMERLEALLGPRDLLSPALVGLVAQALVIRDRPRLIGGLVHRLSAAVEDLADLVSRTIGSTSQGAAEVARRVTPVADAGGAAASGGGAGRLVAQCGALATAAICSAILASSPPVEQVFQGSPSAGGSPAVHRRSVERPTDRGQGPSSRAAPEAVAPAIEQSGSSAAARSEEALRIERRRREAHRRRARVKRARRRKAEKRRARAARTKEKRNENLEQPAEEAIETAPEVVAPETEASPPPATGEQTREEFGL